MSDLFGNHIVGFPTRRLISLSGPEFDNNLPLNVDNQDERLVSCDVINLVLIAI